MAAAAATLSEPSRPRSGIDASDVAALADQPGQARALGAEHEHDRLGRRAAGRASGGVAAARRARRSRRPPPCSRSSAAGSPPTRRSGRCSMAPAAALVTVGRDVDGPVAGQHDAGDARRTRPSAAAAPRLPGSVTPSTATRNGGAAVGRASTQVVEVGLGQRRGAGDDALGRLGAGRGVELGAADLLHRHPEVARPARRCRRAGRRVAPSSPAATSTSRTWRRPASSSSRTAWRPSTCSPPRPVGPRAPAAALGLPARGSARGPAGAGAARLLATRFGRPGRRPSDDPLAPAEGAEPSVRLPFTVTGAPTALGEAPPASRRDGAPASGPSSTTVQSTLPRLPPGVAHRARPPRPAARRCRRRAQRGVGVGEVRRRCRRARPRRAGRRCTAWATTSASLWPARPRLAVEARRRRAPAAASGSSPKRCTSKPSPTLTPRRRRTAARSRRTARSPRRR